MSLRHPLLLVVLCLTAMLSACGNMPDNTPRPLAVSVADIQGSEVVVFAMGLLETDYRFGGKNPEAGLDCSGMVSYVFGNAVGIQLTGSAGDIARKGNVIEASALRPGDLVFFNTNGRPHSHVGIYIGDQRFVHAPSRSGKVRIDNLKTGWFAERFEEARTYFN